MKNEAVNPVEFEAILADKDRQIAADAAVIVSQKERIVALEQRVKLLEKMVFGQRSERIVDVITDDKQLVFANLIKECDALNPSQNKVVVVEQKTANATEEESKKRRPRRNLQEIIPADLPRKEIRIDVPEQDKVCLETGDPLVCIGEERVEKLAFVPGSYYVKVLVYPKYASKANPRQGVIQAPAVDSFVPGTVFDESFVASIIVDKCCMHLPLYRQEERLAHLGFELSRQTLSYLYMQSAEALRPIYNAMKADLIRREVIFTDDTPVRMLEKGKGKTVTGRIWVYVAGGNGPANRIYDYTKDRKGRRAKDFLEGYQGFIHVDAFAGYDLLFEQDGVFECGCWMHVRRKFFEAEDAPPEIRRVILHLIRGIYRYERILKNKSAETILFIRQNHIAPLIERIFDVAATAVRNRLVLPKSSFAKAIGYMQRLGDTLKRFLIDARLRPDNGESERALRSVTIGRKNWLFVGCEMGGQATAILLTLVQTCRVLGINPLEYLTDVLRRVNGHMAHRIHELMPHNWQAARTATAQP